MTESNYEIELKRRAHRRLIGASILASFSIVVIVILVWWLPSPKNLDFDQGLIINIIKPVSSDTDFDIDPLTPTDPVSLSHKPTNTFVNSQPSQAPSSLPQPSSDQPDEYWLSSSVNSSADIFKKIRQSLTNSNIVFQEKSEINAEGKVITHLQFGPYPSQIEALKKKKELSKLVEGLTLQHAPR